MRIQRFFSSAFMPARRGARTIALAAVLSLAGAPAIAQSGVASVQPPPAKPVHRASPPAPYPYPVYPTPSWVHPNEIRCEQDRLLTDRTPCGAGTGQAEVVGRTADGTIVSVPDRPRRCEQDRLLTDETPCTR